MSAGSVAPESERNRVKITALKAMEIQGAGQTLVRVDTDAGVEGIGEAGAPGPVVRGNLKVMERLLLGEDPLAIDRLYNTMTSQMHTYRAHGPTVAGVDIALWDLAGKLLGRPVCDLLAGRYRDRVTIYHTPLEIPADPGDRAASRIGGISSGRSQKGTRPSSAAAPTSPGCPTGAAFRAIPPSCRIPSPRPCAPTR